MIGEVLLGIYQPQSDNDRFMLQTNEHYYSLRMGGFKRETEFTLQKYNSLPCTYIGLQILSIYTDDESVYILLESGDAITSSWVSISNEGIPSLGVFQESADELNLDFMNQEYCYKIEVGADGFSKRI